MSEMKTSKSTIYVKYWLTSLVVLILCMIAVGGITRLTRSGLSIVEWKPVSGIIPPMTDQDWSEQFELYKKTPEFQQVNANFSVQDYKNIFMWEYLHRVLGRLIFLFALIPGLIFWRKAQFSGKRLLLMLSLIAGQGLVGWLMVKSGLNHEPHVSPFMLALHFFSALIVILTIYYDLCVFYTKLVVSEASSRTTMIFRTLGTLLIIQIFYGCLTSGWKAGFVFNTYPLMGGEFFPPGGLIQEPLWINFFTNPSTVQWTHRWIGILVLLASMTLIRAIFKNTEKNIFKAPVLNILILVGIQILLGILNIIFIIPTYLAVIHQVMAALIVLAFYNIVFRIQMKN